VTKVFFHIGLYKTATTWFQRQLFPRLDGVEVVRTKYIDRIAAHLNTVTSSANAPQTIIVSHESLSGSISHKLRPGASCAKLATNLKLIADLVPDRSIIIGFREHGSWLQSAFAQKAKKNFGIDQESYVTAFSLDDLSWCRTLETIDESCPSVFPFLYEELLRAPEALVDDLCRFIGKAKPPNLDQLLKVRENPTPRSEIGQLVSRSLLKFTRTSARKVRKPHVYAVGAWFDSWFPSDRMTLEPDLARTLQQDWNELLARIGERRGRDFAALRKE
jgi:hypothetical protein